MVFDVVIVGAGLSGLMAATELVKSAKKRTVCVLEARDRIGGRTETLDSIDVGAQWVGPNHTELIALTKQYGLSLIDQYYLPSTNTRLTECVGFPQPPLQPDMQQLVNEYIKLIEGLSIELNLQEPWLHAKAEMWDNMSVAEHITQTLPASATEAKRELLLFAQTVFACVPTNTSFLFFLFCLKSGGGIEALGDGDLGAQKWKIDGGVAALCNAMKLELEQQHGAVFKLSNVVEKVITEESTTPLLLLLRDGTQVSAKQVIFALSPMLINKIDFLPKLPSERTALQSSMVSGRAIKVILQYDTAFWLNNRNVQDLRELTSLGPVHNMFDSKVRSKPALVCLITGQAAIDAELLTETERKLQVCNQIKEMYAVQCDPVAYVERVWGHEEFSMGCYSGLYPPTGVFSKFGASLRNPVGNKCFFASTETATGFYGYMEGALLAGKRAAQDVILSS